MRFWKKQRSGACCAVCVEQLSEDKREVLRMVYDAEMEVREVAAELAIPEGTVKSRLYHARREVATRWRVIKREWEDPS